jgi:hypothetical protein
MKIRIVLLPIFFLYNCSTIEYQPIGNIQSSSAKRNTTVYIGYQYYMNNKLYDIPLQLPTNIIDVKEDYKTIIRILEKSNKFSEVSINSITADSELELNLKFYNSMNIPYLFLTAATLYIIPFYYDFDLEIEGNFKNRLTKNKNRKIIKKGKMRYFFGPLPLLFRPFTDTKNHREILIERIVLDILSDIDN